MKTSLADNLQLAFEYKRFHVAIKFDGLKSSRLIAESSAYRMDRCSISHSLCFVAGLFKYRIQSIYYWPSEILDKSKNAHTKLCPIKFNPFKYLQQAKLVTWICQRFIISDWFMVNFTYRELLANFRRWLASSEALPGSPSTYRPNELMRWKVVASIRRIRAFPWRFHGNW